MNDVNAQLDALYAELPAIECEGHCWDSCGPIEMTEPERERIAERGVRIRDNRFSVTGPMTCPALTPFHQCSVYEVRPLICRLWGVARRLPCPYGCKPSRRLTERETFEFLMRAHVIAGDAGAAEQFQALLADPDFDKKARRAQQVTDRRYDLILYQRNGSITR